MRVMINNAEPGWLTRIRALAEQRSTARLTEIHWHDLQELLRERDTLWREAKIETRIKISTARRDNGTK
jgi:hypothetical protein